MAAVSAPAKEYTSALTAFDQSKPPKASAAEVGRAAAGAASDAPEHQEGYRDGCGGKERRHHVDPPGQRTQWHFGEAERNEHVQRIARRMGCASVIRYTPNATIHSPSAAIYVERWGETGLGPAGAILGRSRDAFSGSIISTSPVQETGQTAVPCVRLETDRAR
jgi:hypothetical protein